MKPNIITLTLTGALTLVTAYGQDDPPREVAKTKAAFPLMTHTPPRMDHARNHV
jgi:hypothetical protein